MLTGIRRSGKSVLLEQIRHEINSPNIIFLNFEDLSNQYLCAYHALHDYVCEKIGDSKEQFYLFFDELQEVQGWEKAVNSLRVKFLRTSTSSDPTLRCCPVSWRPTIAGRVYLLCCIPFLLYKVPIADPLDFRSIHPIWRYVLPVQHQLRAEDR